MIKNFRLVQGQPIATGSASGTTSLNSPWVDLVDCVDFSVSVLLAGQATAVSPSGVASGGSNPTGTITLVGSNDWPAAPDFKYPVSTASGTLPAADQFALPSGTVAIGVATAYTFNFQNAGWRWWRVQVSGDSAPTVVSVWYNARTTAC